MQIKEIIKTENKIEYNKLAKNTGNIFNTLDWLKIFGNKIKIFGIYENNEKLIGGFSLYKEQKFGLKIYQDPPFTPCDGPFLQTEAKNPVSIMNKWKEAADLIAKTIDNIPYSIISISLNKETMDTQPFIWKKFKVIPNYTYILNLTNSIEKIQEKMSKEKRNDITKAIKNGLISKQVNNFKIIKSLILKTFLRQKININKFYLDKILFEFTNKDNSFAVVIFDNGKPTATAFCVYDKKTAYYLFGGCDYEKRHHGAGTLAVWKAIKYAKGLGLQYFDFEGSMVPQIERYFRGFGGKLTSYYRINKARLPLEIILKFFKRELF